MGFSTITKTVLIFCIITFIFTYFSLGSYRNISNDFDISIFKTPLQKEVTAKNTFILDDKNYSYTYEVTPLYDYEINGLVVSKYNYAGLKMSEKSEVFTTDLCIIYGDLVKKSIFKNKDLTFFRMEDGVIINTMRISKIR